MYDMDTCRSLSGACDMSYRIRALISKYPEPETQRVNKLTSDKIVVRNDENDRNSLRDEILFLRFQWIYLVLSYNSI